MMQLLPDRRRDKDISVDIVQAPRQGVDATMDDSNTNQKDNWTFHRPHIYWIEHVRTHLRRVPRCISKQMYVFVDEKGKNRIIMR